MSLVLQNSHFAIFGKRKFACQYQEVNHLSAKSHREFIEQNLKRRRRFEGDIDVGAEGGAGGFALFVVLFYML
jgi:hypothetical protein